MSGIVALFKRAQDGVDSDLLQTMLTRIEHRGPDGTGSWYDESVGIGHQQLHSTPESYFDEQPYREGGIVVSGTTRLDNRDELFKKLDIPDRANPTPDSQLISAAYREWDIQCVDYLVGAFAFVVWDENRSRIFCARDHFGVKPLYYHRSNEHFAVSSEMKAILELPFVPTELNQSKIGGYLVDNFGDKTSTYYQSITRLPPAHAMVVDSDEMNIWRYWDLDPTRTVDLGSDAAYERRFRELFEQAVQCRLRTPDPVGTTLSGGMDSSSVTVMARDLLPRDEPLHTFSWAFDATPNSDEREYIEAVTDREGLESHYIFLDDVGVLVDQEDVFTQYDQPPHNSMHYAWWETGKRGRDVGVGTVLGGALGDSAVSYGFGLLPELLRTGRLKQLYNEIQELSDQWGASPRSVFLQKAAKPLIPDPVQRKIREARGEPVLEARRNPILNASFAEQHHIRSEYKDTFESWSLFGQTARQQQYRSLLMGLYPSIFEVSDLRSSLFGFEPRYPFTDKRLVEFSLAMPASQQLSDGWTRSIIRRSLDDLLPKKVKRRVWKTSVSEGFWRALRLEDEEIQKLLEAPDGVATYLDVDELQAAYNRFVSDRQTNPNDARALWKALSLSKWLQHRRDNLC